MLEGWVRSSQFTDKSKSAPMKTVETVRRISQHQYPELKLGVNERSVAKQPKSNL